MIPTLPLNIRDGSVNTDERLDEPVHMASLVNTFNDRVMNTSSIWMVKKEIPSVCFLFSIIFLPLFSQWIPKSCGKLRPELLRRRLKSCIMLNLQSIIYFTFLNVKYRTNLYEVETASVSQQLDRREKLSTDGSAKKLTDLHIDNFDISFGSRILLQNASLKLALGHRYGLIGRNGYGKTTLLRALAK